MRMRLMKSTASLVLLLFMIGPLEAAEDAFDRLVRAAYFSDTCRQEAAALGIVGATDANALFAAFARQFVKPPRPARPDELADDCQVPPVLLINLLRGHGIDAALAFISMPSVIAAGNIRSSGKIDRVLVYLPTLDRYLDPSATPARQAVLDAITRERAARILVRGPSLATSRDTCASLCMDVVPAERTDLVRVKTETIRR
jgi:hypothetical protein